MGKDNEEKFYPQEGQPSGSRRTDSPESNNDSSGAYETNFEIADKYTVGEGEPAPHLRVRHRNRNIDKREDRQNQNNGTKNSKSKRQPLTRSIETISPEQILLPLTKEKISDLANIESDCFITIYQSTHTSGVEVNESMDSTSLKSTLQQVAIQLRERNIVEDVIAKMLQPAYGLLLQDDFWRNLTSGLALFITKEKFSFIKLPTAPKDQVVINSSFYLTPLMPLMTKGDYFYLLVLSKKQAKLFRADAFGMVQIVIPEIPNGVDDVVHFEEKDDQKLWRTGSSGAGGGANYHGTGAGKPDDKENLALYFDEVDETIWKAILNKESAPLLLAGVEYLIPIYKSVAQYKPIWDDALTGSLEHEDMNTLYQAARNKMQPFFEERHKKAVEAYGNHSASERTSSIPADVIPAAHYKRVWHLFVAEGEQLWGKFDEMKNELTIHDTQQEGDEDLIDKAVMKTVVNAGEVHLLPREKMPVNSAIAALMRY